MNLSGEKDMTSRKCIAHPASTLFAKLFWGSLSICIFCLTIFCAYQYHMNQTNDSSTGTKYILIFHSLLVHK